MRKKWYILLLIFIFWFGGYAIVNDGLSYCRDETITHSSGRGTCSWHKGQGMQPEKKPIFYISLFFLLCWGWFFYIREGEFSTLHEQDKHLNYKPNFHGYTPDTPKEVIVQLLMQVVNPSSDAVVYEVSKSFKMNKEEALKIAEEAIRRKQRSAKK